MINNADLFYATHLFRGDLDDEARCQVFADKMQRAGEPDSCVEMSVEAMLDCPFDPDAHFSLYTTPARQRLRKGTVNRCRSICARSTWITTDIDPGPARVTLNRLSSSYLFRVG